jgi:hypothetical protein
VADPRRLVAGVEALVEGPAQNQWQLSGQLGPLVSCQLVAEDLEIGLENAPGFVAVAVSELGRKLRECARSCGGERSQGRAGAREDEVTQAAPLRAERRRVGVLREEVGELGEVHRQLAGAEARWP